MDRQRTQLQATCDHRGMYIDIFTGYPGSVHDSRVLKNSPLYTKRLYPRQGFYILGDGGYPCLSTPISIITPYKEPVRQVVARRFNHHHAKARSIIECLFGSMKTRWRTIFLKALEVKSTFSAEVIACCAILHSLCISNGDIMEPAEDIAWPDNHYHDHHHLDQQSGEHLRDHIAALSLFLKPESELLRSTTICEQEDKSNIAIIVHSYCCSVICSSHKLLI